jgi:3-deoxy-7-phosphoheptulonate synthase
LVIVFKKNSTDEQVSKVIKQLENFGFDVHRSTGKDRIVLGALGVQPEFDIRKIKMLEAVADVFKVTEPFQLASRNYKNDDSIISIGDVEIGGNEVVIMAGPCAIENEEQIHTIAEIISNAGAKILRGGAFKPRTSPYSFQGLGEDGLIMIRNAANKFNLKVVTEVIEPDNVDLVEDYTDIFQVGSRNMQNYPLLKAVSKKGKPVLLKRGFAAKVEEWLMSAEYILAGGNNKVILCERGIRTFETTSRNTFDLTSIPIVKKLSHLPIIADPSHATGIRESVPSMARAAVAADADGLLIEVHHDPDKALSDGPQALLPEQFSNLVVQLKKIAEVIGRKI